MRFSFTVKKLDEALKQTLDVVQDCRRLYDEDGISERELMDTLVQTGQNLEAMREKLKNILAANERRFDMIGFLVEALNMEHHVVIELQSYMRVIPDEELKSDLSKLMMEEMKHEEALAARIRSLGGEAQTVYKATPRPQEISIIELLKQHKQADELCKNHYEVGLTKFREPEFQWMIGQLVMEEREHVSLLDGLIRKYQDAEVLSPELKHIKWVDPYMGTPGDRSWVE
jgi:rubrerythrin